MTFTSFQEQASWVSGCDRNLFEQCELDMKNLLQQQVSLELWADWLTSVVNQILQPPETIDTFPHIGRQLLLKWSFYRWDNLSEGTTVFYFGIELLFRY